MAFFNFFKGGHSQKCLGNPALNASMLGNDELLFLFQISYVYKLDNTNILLIELFIANTSIIHRWFK